MSSAKEDGSKTRFHSEQNWKRILLFPLLVLSACKTEPKSAETPTAADLVVVKTRYSAFIGTTLEAALRTCGITTVVVVGLTADVCVGSTARDAFQRDFHVITLSDCTAELTQAQYEGCLATLRNNFGQVMTSDELLALWNVDVHVP